MAARPTPSTSKPSAKTRVKTPKPVAQPAAKSPAKAVAKTAGAKRPAPWTGRRKVADPKSKTFTMRFTPAQFEQLSDKADAAGLSIGTFARTVLLGSPGPRAARKPPAQKAELARLLGEVGKLGSNVNQIAKAAHLRLGGPSLLVLKDIKTELAAIRAAIMQALGREP